MAKVTVSDLLDYLDYCFRDIHFNYRGLTDTEQRAINQQQCYSIVEEVRGIDMLAFVQHRGCTSLYDNIMKVKRMKYGTNHGDIFKNKTISVYEEYASGFTSDRQRLSVWPAVESHGAAAIRSNLTTLLRKVLGLEEEERRRRCHELLRRTGEFHRRISSDTYLRRYIK